MIQIGELIHRVLASPDDESVISSVKKEVRKLCKDFPIYPEIIDYNVE
jgi:glycine/serine hydroxymethyltransferase